MNEHREQPRAESFVRRLGLLFGAPGALGDALKVRPAWFVPALLGMILVVVGAALIPPDVWEASLRAQIMSQGQGTDTPQISGELSRILFVSAGGVMWFLFMFLFAGVLTFLFAFILGDQGRYRHYLSALAHANIIAALGALLVTPIRIARQDPQLTLSVGTFVEGMIPEGFLLFLLRGMDLFALWSWVVLGILVSRMDPDRRAGSAVAVIMVLMFMVIGVAAWFQSAALA